MYRLQELLLFSIKILYDRSFPFSVLMTEVAKIIEIVGSSEKGWQDAAQAALNEVKKTIHGITGVEVEDMTAKLSEYRKYHIYHRILYSCQNSVWRGTNYGDNKNTITHR
jgi:flavin-binding protein dodecin